MSMLTESGLVRLMDCGSSFSYILSDNSCFLTTEYKVLQSQSGSGFVRCMKMMFNGAIQLCYLPGGLKTFQSVLPALSPNKFLKIALNLLTNVLSVKSNGFLRCQNLDISWDKVFIDQNSLAVAMVYLPLSKKNFADFSEFESQLKAELVRLIQNNENIQSNKTAQLAEFLQNGSISLEKLCTLIGGRGDDPGTGGTELGNNGGSEGIVLLTALNAPAKFEIRIDQPEVLIGKHPNMVNAVIPYNRAISRKHCRVFQRDGHYYIEDLASSNHSYLNRRMLPPHCPAMLSHGDVIRLADSDFKVEIL